jgi:hypothetical protein
MVGAKLEVMWLKESRGREEGRRERHTPWKGELLQGWKADWEGLRIHPASFPSLINGRDFFEYQLMSSDRKRSE